MDGFLFGACCQLKSDSQSHIPKGPGVVMTSYLDYPEADTESDDYDSESLNAWYNSFKPIVTPGYRPGEKVSSSTMKTVDATEKEEIISEGLSQITDSLLHEPPKDSNFGYVKPENLMDCIRTVPLTMEQLILYCYIKTDPQLTMSLGHQILTSKCHRCRQNPHLLHRQPLRHLKPYLHTDRSTQNLCSNRKTKQQLKIHRQKIM